MSFEETEVLNGETGLVTDTSNATVGVEKRFIEAVRIEGGEQEFRLAHDGVDGGVVLPSVLDNIGVSSTTGDGGSLSEDFSVAIIKTEIFPFENIDPARQELGDERSTFISVFNSFFGLRDNSVDNEGGSRRFNREKSKTSVLARITTSRSVLEEVAE